MVTDCCKCGAEGQGFEDPYTGETRYCDRCETIYQEALASQYTTCVCCGNHWAPRPPEGSSRIPLCDDCYQSDALAGWDPPSEEELAALPPWEEPAPAIPAKAPQADDDDILF